MSGSILHDDSLTDVCSNVSSNITTDSMGESLKSSSSSNDSYHKNQILDSSYSWTKEDFNFLSYIDGIKSITKRKPLTKRQLAYEIGHPPEVQFDFSDYCLKLLNLCQKNRLEVELSFLLSLEKSEIVMSKNQEKGTQSKQEDIFEKHKTVSDFKKNPEEKEFFINNGESDVNVSSAESNDMNSTKSSCVKRGKFLSENNSLFCRRSNFASIKSNYKIRKETPLSMKDIIQKLVHGFV